MVAYADAAADAPAAIELFAIEQLVAPGEVAARPLLPSLRYHPAPGELAPGDIQLPWPEPALGEDVPAGVIGELARELGAKVPGRLVASAKSWLSHPAVDRTAPILPWGAAQDVPRVSPLKASASYLAHVRAAWNQRFPTSPLEAQDVVLTVPASFDEAARALTVEAARIAGLVQARLLEEPQAACYDWLNRHRDGLGSALDEARLLLVCDVGGGTTDLTLIRVEPGEQGPRLTRIGVGDHLMLGGDNMDLALAHRAEQGLVADDARMGAASLSQLVQQCRRAKERLLAPDAPAQATVTLLSAGARLIAGARSTELGREEVLALALDGFFPHADLAERPQRRRGALREFGLPYAADPAVTRHVAAFLARHVEVSREALGGRAAAGGGLVVPDALLLNGGVFRSETLARRLLEVLGGWRGAPLRRLHNADPELAVARGAVAYAMARRGQGLRIGGGSARSYFLLLEAEHGRKQGVCLLPRGAEEGQEVRLAERTFSLRLGQPVRFHLASSTADAPHHPGEIVAIDPDQFTELPPIATVLEAAAGRGGAGEAPVQLAAGLTEVGTLAMSCVAVDDPARRWRLEFQLRGEGGAGTVASGGRPHPRFDAALERIERIYGSRARDVGPKEAKALRTELERILGKREGWDTPLLRALYAALWEGARRRRRSPDHERLWFNLAGYCLRPGFGYPLDDWRVGQVWSLYEQGVQYAKDAHVWSEWWTLWRRVAGGLDAQAQTRLLEDIAPALEPPEARAAKRSGPRRQGYDDMVRLAASLERLSAGRKAEVGGWLLARLAHKGESVQTWWAVGRLGARVPFYGSAHEAVPRELAAGWLERVLALDWKAVQPAAFAATMLARMSGDRERDLDRALRERVVERLRAAKAAASWVRMVEEVAELEAADEQRLLGDSLPPGLRLVR